MQSKCYLLPLGALLVAVGCGTEDTGTATPSETEATAAETASPTADLVTEAQATPTASPVDDTRSEAPETPTAIGDTPEATPTAAEPTATQLPDTEVPVCGGDGCDYALTGVVEYERVPSVCNSGGETICDDGTCCLEPDAESLVAMPVRGGLVELVSADGETLIASTYTDAGGAYELGWDGTAEVRILVWSESSEPTITVVDNTQDSVLYGVAYPFFEEPPLQGSVDGQQDIMIPSGWDGQAYDELRAAAPFAVLDSAYEAAHQFISARSTASFADLTINWSANNDSCDGEYEDGCIGTSHWNGEALYILGKAGVDTDEYDDHIIVHEWGHYFEDTASRSDSIGGSHGFGDVKDIRLAFGEGFGNGLSAIVFYPESKYVDTYGNNQASGFYIDMEDNSSQSDPVPGWYSEASVQAILYDLFDPYDESEPSDTVQLGMGALYDVMVLDQPYTESFTSIFSYISHLKARNPDSATAIDDFISSYYDRDGDLGVNPVQDQWGTGEQHNGGSADNLPDGLYAPLSYIEQGGQPVDMKLTHGGDADDGIINWLSQNRYLTFVGDGNVSNVIMDCDDHTDVDLYVYHQGEVVGDRYLLGGLESDEMVELTAFEGTIYTVSLAGWYMSDTDSYDCTISLEHP